MSDTCLPTVIWRFEFFFFFFEIPTDRSETAETEPGMLMCELRDRSNKKIVARHTGPAGGGGVDRGPKYHCSARKTAGRISSNPGKRLSSPRLGYTIRLNNSPGPFLSSSEDIIINVRYRIYIYIRTYLIPNINIAVAETTVNLRGGPAATGPLRNVYKFNNNIYKT